MTVRIEGIGQRVPSGSTREVLEHVLEQVRVLTKLSDPVVANRLLDVFHGTKTILIPSGLLLCFLFDLVHSYNGSTNEIIFIDSEQTLLISITIPN